MNRGLHDSIEALEAVLEDVPENLKAIVIRALYHKHGDLADKVPNFEQELREEVRTNNTLGVLVNDLRTKNKELRKHLDNSAVLLNKGSALFTEVVDVITKKHKG